MLRELKEATGWVPCSQFAAYSRNHTARISELRNNGYVIEYRICDEETGATEYRLVGEQPPKVKRNKADQIELTDDLALTIVCVNEIVKRSDTILHVTAQEKLWKALVTVASARAAKLINTALK
jgi:hypothetical protein